MSNAETIINQLLASETDKEREELRAAFCGLAPDERLAAEQKLIQLLNDDGVDHVVRSWVTTFLGLLGTSGARQGLMDRLPDERNDLVRRWIARNLCEHFPDDDCITAIAEQFDRERTTYNRNSLAAELAESGSPVAFPKLIKLLDDEHDYVRFIAANGLGRNARRQEAVQPLIQHLGKERVAGVSQVIIETLSELGNPEAVPAMVNWLQDRDRAFQLQVAALRALGRVASFSEEEIDEEVIQVILGAACSADSAVSGAATEQLVRLLSRDRAALRLARFGLEHADNGALPCVANAVRVIGGTAAIEHLRAESGDRAQRLLQEIGGALALDVLVDRRVKALKDASSRVQQFDDQAVMILRDTINQAKRGFTMSLWMSGTIFVIGVVLLLLSMYLAAQPDATQFQQLFGVGGGVAGLGTIVTMFYKGPLERIAQAVANLVQVEIAFLGFIRQVTQISAMFEREYVDSDSFGVKELKTLLAYTERIVRETMPLVRRYTLSGPGRSVGDEE